MSTPAKNRIDGTIRTAMHGLRCPEIKAEKPITDAVESTKIPRRPVRKKVTQTTVRAAAAASHFTGIFAPDSLRYTGILYATGTATETANKDAPIVKNTWCDPTDEIAWRATDAPERALPMR